MDPWTDEAAAVAATLGTDLQRGLSDAEAARRFADDGPNVLRAAPRRSFAARLAAQLRDPLVLLLLAAAGIALAAWAVEGRHGWPADAIVVGAIVLANALLGLAQEARAENAVAALARLTAATSALVRDGRLLRLPSEQVVRGDLLVLGEGDAVGADARLVECASLRVLEASLTGESDAVGKRTDALPAAAALADRRNMVFKGTSVVQGSARAVVTATGMHSEVGAIAGLLDATADAPTPMQNEVAYLGRALGIAALVIAAVVIATLLLTGPVRGAADVVRVLLLGVALAVAAVPEGLPAVLSVVLAIGVQRMARRHAVLKNLASAETLGSASVIATDKTGTLTRAEMTIRQVVTPAGHYSITGVGHVPEGRLEHHGEALTGGERHAEVVAVLAGGALAGNAALHRTPGGAWEIQGDPTEAAFLVAEHKLGDSAPRRHRWRRTGELPFTSDRRMMSTVQADRTNGDAQSLFTKGAPAALLERCTHANVHGQTVPLDAALRARILADVDTLADAALRTLAVASRPLAAGERVADGEALERGLVWLGVAGLMDPPRLEVAPAIRQAQQAGIRIVMITGDHPRTAQRIAADLGIAAPGAAPLTGPEIDALEDAPLALAVRGCAVFARVAPRHKLRIVRALQAGGEVVAMTGDGVNDAPALKAADIGIAMGVTGTEVTKQAARMILADDNFATIVAAVREGRGVLDNIRKFLRYLLSSNLGEVLTVFLGVLFGGAIGLGAGADGAVALPLLATQILWINLVTDSAPALAMGVDPIAAGVMQRAPRRPGDRLIDAAMWRGVLGIGLVMALSTLATFDLFLPGGLVEGTHDLAYARTAGFTVLVLAQLFNVFNARSETDSARHGLFANPWLWASAALAVALQVAVVHLPVLGAAFGTVPLAPRDWLVCVGMASAVLWFSEARKALGRR